MNSLTSGVALAGVLFSGLAQAQVTERVSVGTNGVEGLGEALLVNSNRWLSSDGRFVAFCSSAGNLVSGDSNSCTDVFVHDRVSDTTERVSVDSAGLEGDSPSGDFGWSISADGRFVAFDSESTNFVAQDWNGALDVFVHDRSTGTTELVSVDSSGNHANGGSWFPSISADGRYVAFQSLATNLVPGDTNANWDVFVFDRIARTTERVSVTSNGGQVAGNSAWARISGDGRFVAFSSNASALVPDDTNGVYDVFVRDRLNGTTSRASVSSNGTQGNGDSKLGSISNDGRFVVFPSLATNLVQGDTNSGFDAFIRDMVLGTTERVSVSSSGAQSNGNATPYAVSDGGRFVEFGSDATNLVRADTNAKGDCFVRDRRNDTTELVSITTGGIQSNDNSGQGAMSPDGRFVLFLSLATNLVPNDTNGGFDMFLRDRSATGFSSICDPGVGTVIACPCGNPPSGPGHGCDNSSATGGASIFAKGIAYLALDDLVFTTAGEKPTATSIVLQGDSLLGTGVVFGQGVRCVAGTLKRLFVKSAVNGGITAPEFSIGDPTVSARSASLGAPIQPGQPYLYLVYYRDSSVLGGCPATSTFNATQTAQINWWP